MEFKMNENGFQTETGFELLKISGNDEFGVRPYQLMISSIAGCSGGVLKNILHRMRLDFSDITITAEAKRNPDIANRIEEVIMHYTITGKNLDPHKVERALELTFKNCSMIQSVKDQIKITETHEIQND